MAADRTAPYIFVSYASADRERVMPVVEALRRTGVSVWLDQQGISGGENYALEITEAIEGCAALVLMCSAIALASRNVKQEIALAWKFARPYVPLLLEAVAIPKDVLYWLEAAQWIEVLDKPEQDWLPQVLAALEPFGIAPMPEKQEVVHLAGREKELALLREKVAAAKGGKGGLVLIGGEAGIGKTTLAVAVLREAAGQGCIVLEGHCFDLAETPPYGPWIDLFARYRPSPSSPPLPDAFVGRGTVGAVASQIALFVQVQDFLATLGRQRPIMLLLDDLHWSDPASLDLLRFLSRSVADVPLLILVTYRSDELTRRHPLYALLPQLARDTGAVRLDLDRLNDEAVRFLVGERYDLPDGDTMRLVAYLQSRAEGNALFVGELFRSLEEAGALERDEDGWRLDDLSQTAVPTLLRQVIEGRVARLDDDAQEALGAAAVIGQEVPFAVWASVSGADEETLTEIVEQAAASRLMEETADGTGARFIHALIRETLYGGMLPSRRRRLHRAAGETLAALPDPDADAVAYHFRVISDGRTATWLAKAGERARAAFSYVTAVERMQEAVGLLDKPEDAALAASLCVQIAWLLRFSDGPQAIRYSEEAVRRADEADDPVLAGVAQCRLGSSLCLDGQYILGLAASRAGVAALEALPQEAWERTAMRRWYVSSMDDGPSSFNLRSSLAYALAIVGALAEALALVGGTLDIGDAAYAMASQNKLHALRIAADYLGRPDVAKRAFEEIGRVTRAAEDWHLLAGTHNSFLFLTVLAYHADDLAYREEIASTAERAWARAQALHLVAPFPVRAVRFPLDFIAGAWHAAKTNAAGIPQLGGLVRPMANVILATLARLRGRPEEAWQYLREWFPQGAVTEPGGQILIFSLQLLHLGGLMALDAGDLDAAREWAEASDRWLAWSGAVSGKSEGQALWAHYHRQAGDIQQARTHAEQALVHATEPRQPLALISAHRLLGELDTDAGRFADAQRHLDASLALADACEAPFERALTQLAMAELRATMGEHDEAAQLLAAVRAICEPLGAQPTLARADALAARLARFSS